MSKKDFFEELYASSSCNEDKIYELLSARGFLLEHKNNELAISDNSHKQDASYLDSILRKYGIGHVNKNKITIERADFYRALEQEFVDGNRIDGETLTVYRGWEYFARRTHGYKVPVEYLEPYVARYVKAISSAGVLTSEACDGNHGNLNRLYITFAGRPSEVWHHLLNNVLVSHGIILSWDGCKIAWRSINQQYDIYSMLRHAAEFIYTNRMTLRCIKTHALEGLTRSYLKNADVMYIEKVFTDNAVKERVETGLLL